VLLWKYKDGQFVKTNPCFTNGFCDISPLPKIFLEFRLLFRQAEPKKAETKKDDPKHAATQQVGLQNIAPYRAESKS
jgi:hypothetical protein